MKWFQRAARPQPGQVKVQAPQGQIIRVTLRGFLTAAEVRQVLEGITPYVAQLRTAGQKVYLLINMKGITGQDSSARSEGKRMGLAVDRVAIYGGGRMIQLVSQYVVNASGQGGRTQFFATESQARQWLKRPQTAAPTDPAATHRAAMAILVLIIAGAALVGWGLDVPVLRSLAPGLKAMNPVTASTFVGLALLLAAFRSGAQTGWRRTAGWVAAGWSLLYGASTLLAMLAPGLPRLDHLI